MEAGEIYSHVITTALVGIWQRVLGHFSVDVLRRAFRSVLQNCRFFPTPADVFAVAESLAMADFLETVESVSREPRLIDYNEPETDGCDVCRYTGFVVGKDNKARRCECRRPAMAYRKPNHNSTTHEK